MVNFAKTSVKNVSILFFISASLLVIVVELHFWCLFYFVDGDVFWVCCAHPTEGNSTLNASSVILPMPTLTYSLDASLLSKVHDTLCSCHTLQSRDCRVQLFILAFSVNPLTEPLWAPVQFSFHACIMKAVQQPWAFMLATGMGVKIFCCGSVLKEMICKIDSSMCVKLSEKIQGRNVSLLVFYHMNYLPFDQCFPSLWTLFGFCKTKKIDEILKPKTK